MAWKLIRTGRHELLIEDAQGNKWPTLEKTVTISVKYHCGSQSASTNTFAPSEELAMQVKS